MAVEQAGFIQEQCTLDHCLILVHFMDKYIKNLRGILYEAFLDLKTVLDSSLWEALSCEGAQAFSFISRKLIQSLQISIKIFLFISLFSLILHVNLLLINNSKFLYTI